MIQPDTTRANLSNQVGTTSGPTTPDAESGSPCSSGPSRYFRSLSENREIESQRAEILTKIRDFPALDEPRLCYAMHLEKYPFTIRDNARAELIRLQIARGEGEPCPRERELLHNHERDWMRELGQARGIRWERGFATGVTMAPRSFAAAKDSLAREPITCLRIHLPGGSEEGGRDLVAALEAPHFKGIEQLTFWIADAATIMAIHNLVGTQTPKLREIHCERFLGSHSEILEKCENAHYPEDPTRHPPHTLKLSHVALTFGSFR